MFMLYIYLYYIYICIYIYTYIYIYIYTKIHYKKVLFITKKNNDKTMVIVKDTSHDKKKNSNKNYRNIVIKTLSYFIHINIYIYMHIYTHIHTNIPIYPHTPYRGTHSHKLIHKYKYTYIYRDI